MYSPVLYLCKLIQPNSITHMIHPLYVAGLLYLLSLSCSFNTASPSPLTHSSGDGSSTSQQSEEPRSPHAMAQAVRVHDDINKVMYFA